MHSKVESARHMSSAINISKSHHRRLSVQIWFHLFHLAPPTGTRCTIDTTLQCHTVSTVAAESTVQSQHSAR
jgi:hypothetical protein